MARERLDSRAMYQPKKGRAAMKKPSRLRKAAARRRARRLR
jgi:hypothetical protein